MEEYANKYIELNKIVSSRILDYEVYRNDRIFMDLIKDGGVMNILNHKNTDNIIRCIETNNESTLIGTLNFMNFMTIINHDTPLLWGQTGYDEHVTKFLNIPEL